MGELLALGEERADARRAGAARAMEIYGSPYSTLLPAQHSTLDVVDKTAVVVNEHFEAGDVPSEASFRNFWTEMTGELGEPPMDGTGYSLPNLALAELADDMATDGICATSQALRHAGTHGILHSAPLATSGVTQQSRSKIDLMELADATIRALQVTRTAYFHLIDLVAMWNYPDDHQGSYRPFPDVRYFHEAVAEQIINQDSQQPQDGRALSQPYGQIQSADSMEEA